MTEAEKFIILPKLHYKKSEDKYNCPDLIDEKKILLQAGPMIEKGRSQKGVR